MDAHYSFYVKSIATYAPAFLRYNNSVLASVNDEKPHVGFGFTMIFSEGWKTSVLAYTVHSLTSTA